MSQSSIKSKISQDDNLQNNEYKNEILQNNNQNKLLNKNKSREEKLKNVSNLALEKLKKILPNINSKSFDLKLEPSNFIVFKLSNNKFESSELKINNPTNNTKCYKIKCTSKEVFRVNPVFDYIKPDETKTINISLKCNPKNDNHFFKFYYITTVEFSKKPRDLWTSDTVYEGSLRVPIKFLNEDNTIWTPNKELGLQENVKETNDKEIEKINEEEEKVKTNFDSNKLEQNDTKQFNDKNIANQVEEKINEHKINFDSAKQNYTENVEETKNEKKRKINKEEKKVKTNLNSKKTKHIKDKSVANQIEEKINESKIDFNDAKQSSTNQFNEESENYKK